MNPTRNFALTRCTLAAVILTSAASFGAWAQTAPSPPTDIELRCPGIAQRLETELAPVLRAQGKNADVRVAAQITQGRLAQVAVSSAQSAYGSAVRRALQGFACTESGTAQTTFLVQLVEPETAWADQMAKARGQQQPGTATLAASAAPAASSGR